MRKGGKFYDEQVSVAERKRKEALREPHNISCKLLQEVIYPSSNMRSVLDAGCGHDRRLAEWVIKERHSHYIGIDVRPEETEELIRSLAEIGLETLADIRLGDIQDLPVRADVVHERFVFTHLEYNERQIALREMLRAADIQIILLEYDWRNMRSTFDSEALDAFKRIAFQAFDFLGIDPYCGKTLQSLARSVIRHLRSAKFIPYEQPEGDYTDDLIKMCRSLGTKLEEKQKGLSEQFAAMEESLRAAPIRFVPAEIDALVITK